MSSSKTKQTPTLGKNQKASGTKHLDPHRSWSHVASGTILSCHHNTHSDVGSQSNTTTTNKPKKGLATRSSTKDSKYANRNEDLFADVITPYIVGRESNSTLIEIINVQDTHALKDFLCSYNRDDQYPFYGALLKARNYLQRTFIETCWDTNSDVHQRLISSGLEMDKSTIIKGYPSLPSDAKVQRVHVDNLPIKEPRLLRDLLQKRFSSLGEVLDLGFHLDGRMFYGSGYVVLNLNTTHPITEKLSRELPWAEEGRKLLLKWDDMSQYCRYCQSLDHCKADCAELRNLMICHTCNEHGHLSKQCPRSNLSSNVPNKVVTVAEMKPRKSTRKPAPSSTGKETSPIKPAPTTNNSTGTSPSPAPFCTEPLSRGNIQAITSVYTKFLSQGIFPVIPWKTWIKPKPLGGLGVLLDVSQQHAALYFCWVQPLLHPSDSPTMLDLMLVMMLVNKQNRSEHVQVPLLFPITRSSGLAHQRTNTVAMIYKAVDKVNRNFNTVQLNLATTLILPIKAVLHPSNIVNKMPLKTSQLIVVDFYRQNPRRPLQLQARKPATIPQDIRRASNKILKQIKTNAIQLFSPLTESLYFKNQQGLQHPVTTKVFRKACTEAYTSSITSSNWNFFWTLSLNLVSRNVIYRYITRTIPTKRLLHYFKIVDSPLFPICGPNENAVHLLFLCPSKVSIWKAIIFEFLWSTVSIGDIIQACSTLDFTSIQYVSKDCTTAHHTIVIVTLGNIWRAQVRLIFDSAPFQWPTVVNQIKDELLHLHAEQELRKQM
ncbi:hypothetical protein MAM1_0005c00632 [Mucor ambiguus]|uniref:CCHC-type domain-containing protein n=1 Tax=Mucor ambiguus TaxID=91626 RepID=A0A0C9LQ33_9FUNG|nr:hypothetical protein MAM1_0005c00632 [Mucor ambiguus]